MGFRQFFYRGLLYNMPFLTRARLSVSNNPNFRDILICGIRNYSVCYVTLNENAYDANTIGDYYVQWKCHSSAYSSI